MSVDNPTSLRPVYAHDCDKCAFHGTAHDEEGRPVDLYTCDGSVIGRFDSDPPAYTALPAEIYMMHSNFFRARGTIGRRYVELAEALCADTATKT